jgi:hypothetical protein
MTFKITTRGAGGYLVAEYRCPTHGVFEALVQRDPNGDAPDAQPCFYVLDDSGDPDLDHLPSAQEEDDTNTTFCCGISPWTISAPSVANDALKVRAVSLGGDMKDRPPGMLDTRGLAEGMKMSEWKKIQRDKQRERRHQQMIKKGIRSKRIQVG